MIRLLRVGVAYRQDWVKFTAKTFYLISSSLKDFQTAEAKKTVKLKKSSYGN
jgi:hypothetical protein